MSRVKVDLKTVYQLENPPFQKCPYCCYDEFMTKEYISGYTHYYYRFDGDEADNGEMYEDTTMRPVGVYAYCAKCGKKLFPYKDKK